MTNDQSLIPNLQSFGYAQDKSPIPNLQPRPLRILIADDEIPARSELSYILKTLAPEAVLYEATTGEQVLSLVEREPIDVILLDIQMPGLDGLAVAAMIMDKPDPPLIVFATAYNEHALRAFELATLDYVVKPFDERRLARTMERVRRALAEREVIAQRQAAMHEYLHQAAPAGELTKLWGQRDAEGRYWVLVDYKDILWVMAEAKRVYVQTAAGDKLQVHYTLKELEPRLAHHGFVRVHKAYLVNLDHVTEVVPWFSGTYLIRMADQARTQIPMSRGYVAHLKQVTGWR